MTETETKPELTEDEAAERYMLMAIASTIVMEVAIYRVGCWRRRRRDACSPPLTRRAGKAGYFAGYRDGLADAAAEYSSGVDAGLAAAAAAKARAAAS